jgi:predicted adenylyl cyclase CyaB
LEVVHALQTHADHDGTNLELKARVADLAAVRERIRATGAEWGGGERQKDRYFAVPGGRLKLRESSADGVHLIVYQRPEEGPFRPSRFHRLPVSAPGPLAGTLESMLGAAVVVEKTREIWWWRDVRIHLDDVAGQGTFLEFEARLDRIGDGVEAARRLAELCRLLAIQPADVVGGSYGEMPCGATS